MPNQAMNTGSNAILGAGEPNATNGPNSSLAQRTRAIMRPVTRPTIMATASPATAR